MQAETKLEGESVAELLTRSYEYAYDQGWTEVGGRRFSSYAASAASKESLAAS